MNRKFVSLLFVVLFAALGVVQPTLAQQQPSGVPAAEDPATPSDTPGDVMNGCQDSLLLEPFPILRMLIDLITQLLDLLERADQQLSGENGTDPPAVDPTAIDLNAIDPTSIPATTTPTTLPSGGFGVGPVPSVR